MRRFGHSYLTDAVKQHYFSTYPETLHLQALITYFNSLPTSSRKAEELPYHVSCLHSIQSKAVSRQMSNANVGALKETTERFAQVLGQRYEILDINCLYI